MVAKARLYKRFNTYTDVLYYTIVVEKDLKDNLVPYTCEISYSEYLGLWTVIYDVYDAG